MLLSFTACGSEEPIADSSKFLQESVYNLYNLKSFKYTADVKADIEEAETKNKANADITLNGAVSGQDATKVGSEFTVVAKLGDTSGEYRFDFSAKLFTADVYLKLLALPSIPNFPVDGLKGLVGKWWKINASDLSNIGAVKKLDGMGVAYDKLDEKGKKRRDLILTSKFFDEIEYDGTESLNGLNVYKYNFVVDGDGVYKYAYELAKLDGQEKDVGLQDIKALLDTTFFSGTVWIDSVSKTVVKFDLALNEKKSKSAQFTSMDVTLVLSDMNKPFNVETPTDFEIFDLGQFLGSFLGSGAASGLVTAPAGAASGTGAVSTGTVPSGIGSATVPIK